MKLTITNIYVTKLKRCKHCGSHWAVPRKHAKKVYSHFGLYIKRKYAILSTLDNDFHIKIDKRFNEKRTAAMWKAELFGQHS